MTPVYRLTIEGTGFSKDPTSGGNQVFVGGHPCNVIVYDSVSETKIVVDTPPSENFEDLSNLPIEVRPP